MFAEFSWKTLTPVVGSIRVGPIRSTPVLIKYSMVPPNFPPEVAKSAPTLKILIRSHRKLGFGGLIMVAVVEPYGFTPILTLAVVYAERLRSIFPVYPSVIRSFKKE